MGVHGVPACWPETGNVEGMCAAHQYKAVAVQKPCQLCLPDSATQHEPWLLFAPAGGRCFHRERR